MQESIIGWGLRGSSGKIPRVKCKGLAHVNLRVPDLAGAVEFYGGALGLERIDRRDEKGRGAWFRIGGAEIHLTEDATPQPPSRRHVAITVDDLRGARSRVTALGSTVEREEAGRFWTRDPAGNRIEFVEERG